MSPFIQIPKTAKPAGECFRERLGERLASDKLAIFALCEYIYNVFAIRHVSNVRVRGQIFARLYLIGFFYFVGCLACPAENFICHSHPILEL